MQNHSGYHPRCVIPGCSRKAWITRRLLICGGHARGVLDAMSPEVEFRAQRIVDERVRRLQAVADDQHRTIRQLRGELPPDPKPTRKPPAVEGVVYYLRSGGYIKIGWTSHLAKRMRAYAPDSILLATEPGTRSDEQHRHRMFAVHRTHGREWYAMVAPLTQHIERVKAQHGTPDPVAFAARPVEVPRPHSTKPKPKPAPWIQRVS